MKVRIKNWDDAVKAALADSEDWFVEDDNIFFHWSHIWKMGHGGRRV